MQALSGRSWSRRAGVALLLLAAACDAKVLGRDGGIDGGSGGSGGQGGTTGVGGQGGNSSMSCDPAVNPGLGCLRALYAACPFDDSCRSSSDDAGFHICYPSGTRVDGGRVSRPDGTLCFTIEYMTVPSPGFPEPSTNLTWKDPNGSVVATGSQGIGAVVVQCPGGASTLCTVPTHRLLPGTLACDDLSSCPY